MRLLFFLLFFFDLVQLSDLGREQREGGEKNECGVELMASEAV